MKTRQSKIFVVKGRQERRSHHEEDHHETQSNVSADSGLGEEEVRNKTRRQKFILLCHFRKKILRLLGKFRSCFRPCNPDHNDEERTEQHINNERLRADSGIHSSVRNLELQVEEARESAPSDVVAPRTASYALNIAEGVSEAIAPIHYEELASAVLDSSLPPTSREVDTPAVSSSYSFFKDDLPRRIKSGPAVEKPTYSIEVGKVASLKNVLSEHHVFRSYSHQFREAAGTNTELSRESVQKSEENEEHRRICQLESVPDKESNTSGEMVRNVDSTGNGSSSRDPKSNESHPSLLETPIGKSSSETRSQFSPTRNSSTQFSSLISENAMIRNARTISEDANVSGVGESQSCLSGSEDSNHDLEMSGSREIQSMERFSQGIEEIKQATASGARWLYQALCSLCSYEKDKSQGLIII